MKKSIMNFIFGLVLCFLLMPATAHAASDIASGSGWNIDADGCLHITGAVTNNSTESNIKLSPWYDERERILSVVTEPGASVNDCIGLFLECSNLKSVDLSNLNTASVTDMCYMFAYCGEVTNINFAGFNTLNVTDMCYMFVKCESLDSLDLTSFNTAKVTNMSYMFYGCKDLEEVDVTGFNTSKVTEMDGMFHSCLSLTDLDVSRFDTSKVTDMSTMFYHCSNLMSIDVSNFNTTAIPARSYMQGMFASCSSLVEISITKTLVENNKDDLFNISSTWYYKESNEVFSINSMTAPKATLVREAVAPDLNGWYVEDRCLYITGDVNNKSTDTIDYTPWKAYKRKITTIVTLPGASVNNGVRLFEGCENLISADLSNLDTSSVTSCRMMFYDCSNLAALNLSGVNTSNVTNMSGMFYGCKQLTSLDLSSFDTRIATNMSYMFDGCEKLVQLNISSFNTPKLTDMRAMFFECKSLNSLDLSNFNTSSVYGMASLFGNCSRLRSINLSSFDTYNVSDMESMFDGCVSLVSLDLSNFDMYSGTGVENILKGCSSLVSFTANAKVYSIIADSLINISTDWKDESTDISYQTVQDINSISQVITITRVKTVASTPEWYLESNGCLHIIGELPSYETKIDGKFFVVQPWTISATPVVTIVAEPGAAAVDCHGLFENRDELISANLVELDISKTTKFSGMFAHCDKLKKISAKPELFSAIANDLMSLCSVWKDATDGTLYMSADDIRAISNQTTLIRLSTIASGAGWSLADDGTLFINGEVTNKSGVASDETPWRSYKNQITSVVTFPGAMVDNAAFLFANCPNLTKVDLSKLDTRIVQSMRSMFENCSSLTTLDVSCLDTRNVMNMAFMFSGCSALKTLNVSNLDTSNVSNFNYMFNGCSSLTSLDVSGFKTAKAEYMSYMFAGCSKVEDFDVYLFNTSNVTAMNGMFNGCSSAYVLYLRNFDCSKVKYAEDMFAGCTAINELDINSDLLSKVAGQLMSLSLSWFNATDGLVYSDEESLKGITEPAVLAMVGIYASGDGWAIDELDNLFITGAVSNPTGSSDQVPWKNYRSYIKTVTAKPGALIDNGRLLFYNCPNLKTLDLTALDISKVTSVVNMIGNCTAITRISASPAIVNVLATQMITLSSNWVDVATGTVYSSATELKGIATNVTLEKVAKGEGWYVDASGALHINGAVDNPSVYDDQTPWKDYKYRITAVVTHAGASLNRADYLFVDCPNLLTVDLSNLDASAIRSYYYAFANCTSLKSVTFGNINTSNATTFESMFMGDRKLESVDLSGISTGKVWQFGGMFHGCSSLKTLRLSSNFVTSTAKYTSQMFKDCSSLEELDVRSFDTSNVTTMVDMFRGCSSLKKLDLSGFNVDKVTVNTSYNYMNGIFTGCSSLATIYINNSFLSKVAPQIIALCPTWADEASGKLYNTADGLKTMQGDAHLIKHASGKHIFADQGDGTHKCTLCSARGSHTLSTAGICTACGYDSNVVKTGITGTIIAEGGMNATVNAVIADLYLNEVASVAYELRNGAVDYTIEIPEGDYYISVYSNDGIYYTDLMRVTVGEGMTVFNVSLSKYTCIGVRVNVPDYSGFLAVNEVRDEINMPYDLPVNAGVAETTLYYVPGTHAVLTFTVSGYAVCEVEIDADADKTITVDMLKNQKLTHTLSVQNNLAINYYIAQSAIPNLTNVVLNIEKDVYDTNGVKTIDKTVLLSKLGDYGYGPEHKFVYEGVASYQAVNEIRATLTGEYNGVKYTFAPDVYSIETYCYNQIGKSSVAAKTKRLLVDLLNYCSASQVHFGIKTDTLANRNLTSAQKALGTTTAPVLNNISGTKSLAGATARFNGKTLVLGNNVELKIYILLDDSVQKDNVRLRITYQNVNGENIVAYVPYSTFTYDSDRKEYAAKYTGLIAPEFRKVMQLTIMEGDKEISDTDTYSIETYAYNRVNGSSKQTLKDVVTEMMKYSDSALAYFQ